MIRKYQDTDLDSILEIWYESTRIAHPFLTAAFLEKEKTNVREVYLPNTETWVFEQEQAVAGFISILILLYYGTKAYYRDPWSR